MVNEGRKELQDEVRFRILEEIDRNPEISQRELSRRLGTSLGRAHYLLRALVEKGFIKIGNFSAAEDKVRYRYLLTARGAAEKAGLTRRFLARKLAEYDALKIEIERLQREVGEQPPGGAGSTDHRR
ncbi:MarR family EPS-associated transcriptional regulator [Salipiger marinus]|uniref:MarR family EPS-associated transcriptional regulator n=1 Tax=Salipiger marinus TaxID=555512 RepID=UPI002C8D0952|nr:MarR family EPS-associated transcriptional regulator [Salipiger manganoxidans]MEB3421678.1 MarR family EPS-associated transcriptional regulator [Salipiger manganoxidans]